MQFRKERMQNLLRKELNNLLQREVETPGALITITDVSMTGDLREANVHVAIVPKDTERDIIKMLTEKRKMFRHMLIKRLPWKLIPALSFEIDSGAESAAAVEKALLDESIEKP